MAHLQRFVALYDVHWGYERDASRHKSALHDAKAVSVAMQFIADFQPHHVILGGDILDCGSISHHRKGELGKLEGLRLVEEAQECRETIIAPIEQAVKGRLIYHIGNHEDWLQDLTDEIPSLSGIVDIRALLKLSKRWEVIPSGGASRLGKMTFIHGDQIKSSVNPAMYAVTAYERNVRFGHYHTYQVATKTTPVDMNGHTGMCIPCLCKKGHVYGQGAPNKWMQGFMWGYLDGSGIFSDYVTVIVNGQAVIGGKVYTG